MSEKDYKLAMLYMDLIVKELNFIAAKIGHPTMDEYFNRKK